MKVTAELLKKYISGECTPEEQLLVENWVPGDEDITLHIPEEKLKQLSEEIWQNIEPAAGQQTIVASIGRPIARYAAAACLVIGIAYAAMFLLRQDPAPGEAAYDNTLASSDHHMQTTQFNITLLPGSRAHVTDGPGVAAASAEACGNFMLENKQSQQITLSYTTSCDSLPKGNIGVRQLKAGKTYVLIEYNNASGSTKHLVVEKRHARLALADLFPREEYKSIIKRIFI